MNKNPPDNATESRSVDQQQACSVKRLEFAWQIQRKNSLDIVRHSPRTASEPSLNYHEQIISELCEALSQNAVALPTASKPPPNT